ncbi:hypothetical protein PR003_g6412 [Phytophthora rubi]|uniref:Uncharacterized protein n=1 Tax=Phytophthora rubi TaxID=129364 RepID=A0A6A4G0W3_9STRA|nr:hypothetical protein PR003_g6412 [Phytophthora rubi]
MLTPSETDQIGPTSPVPPATCAAPLVPPAAGPGLAPVSTTSTSVRVNDPVIQRQFEQQAQLLQKVTLLSPSVFHRSSEAEPGPPPPSSRGVAMASADPRSDRAPFAALWTPRPAPSALSESIRFLHASPEATAFLFSFPVSRTAAPVTFSVSTVASVSFSEPASPPPVTQPTTSASLTQPASSFPVTRLVPTNLAPD